MPELLTEFIEDLNNKSSQILEHIEDKKINKFYEN